MPITYSFEISSVYAYTYLTWDILWSEADQDHTNGVVYPTDNLQNTVSGPNRTFIHQKQHRCVDDSDSPMKLNGISMSKMSPKQRLRWSTELQIWTCCRCNFERAFLASLTSVIDNDSTWCLTPFNCWLITKQKRKKRTIAVAG